MSDFIKKWSTKKASRPRAGSKNTLDVFRGRVMDQKSYLEEYESDPSSFKKWRSTWFQRVPGGFGVTVGRDSIDAGNGLSYVVVETSADVSEFLDDLLNHAVNDPRFQQALEANRLKRVDRLNAGKAKIEASAVQKRGPKAQPSSDAGTTKTKRVARGAKATAAPKTRRSQGKASSAQVA